MVEYYELVSVKQQYDAPVIERLSIIRNSRC
jgi:hypothetical protein